MLALTAACVRRRAGRARERGWPPRPCPRALADRRRARPRVLAALALAVWLPRGRSRPAGRAAPARPPRVLAAFSPRRRRAREPPRARDAFGAPLLRDAGRAHPQRQPRADGTAVVDLRMRLDGGPRGVLRIRLGGQPLPRRRPADGPQRGDARPAAATRRATAAGSRSSTTPRCARWSGSADGRACASRIELSLDRRPRRAARVRGTPVSAHEPAAAARAASQRRPARSRWPSTSRSTAPRRARRRRA